MKDILVSEMFGPVVQGEGPLIGRPTVFIRSGGCDYKCSWCDTLYAVLPKYKKDWWKVKPVHVLEEILRLSNNKPMLVTLSGGNPALQDFRYVVNRGGALGYSFAVECQGSVRPQWFDFVDQLVLSPKPPSSGMGVNWDTLAECANTQALNTYFKVVVFDEEDFAFAKEVWKRMRGIPFYLQAGTDFLDNEDVDKTYGDEVGIWHEQVQSILNRTAWLQQRVLEDEWNKAIVLPQLHTLIHGNKRGV